MQIYRVGGAVRDSLLQRPYHEQDWLVVGATPQAMLDLGYRQVGRDFPVFLHPDTGEEYALARTERKQGSGHTGFVCHSAPDVTLEQDLLRRDLTINAIAETTDGELIDPYGGQQDLQQRLLRHVSPAFAEDPLRVLRVARFQAQLQYLGFSIADETLALMRQISHSGELQTLASERVWKEMQRALQAPHPAAFFQSLRACDAISELFPQWQQLSDSQLQRMNQAAEQQHDCETIFSHLFTELNQTDSEQLLDHLNLPRSYRDQAQLAQRFAHDPADSAETILTIMQAADPFRRPQRWQFFLQLIELLDQQRRIRLQTCYQAAQTVDAKSLAAQGLQGKAIATALQQQRLDKIRQCLQAE